jgi:hypothetical protein
VLQIQLAGDHRAEAMSVSLDSRIGMADIRYRAIANTPRIGVPPTITIFQNSTYRRAEQVNSKHLGGTTLPFEA